MNPRPNPSDVAAAFGQPYTKDLVVVDHIVPPVSTKRYDVELTDDDVLELH